MVREYRPVTAVEDCKDTGGVRVVFGNPTTERGKNWSSVRMTRNHWDAIVDYIRERGGRE